MLVILPPGRLERAQNAWRRLVTHPVILILLQREAPTNEYIRTRRSAERLNLHKASTTCDLAKIVRGKKIQMPRGVHPEPTPSKFSVSKAFNVRRRHDQPAARFENPFDFREQARGVSDMFNHVTHGYCVKTCYGSRADAINCGFKLRQPAESRVA